MPMLARSEAKDTQPLVHAGSYKANFPGWASALSSELPQQQYLEGGVSCSDKAFLVSQRNDGQLPQVCSKFFRSIATSGQFTNRKRHIECVY